MDVTDSACYVYCQETEAVIASLFCEAIPNYLRNRRLRANQVRLPKNKPRIDKTRVSFSMSSAARSGDATHGLTLLYTVYYIFYVNQKEME